jgi:integrase
LKIRNFCDDQEPKLMMPPSAKGGGRNRAEKKHGKPYPVPITPALAARLRLAAKGRPGHASLLLRSDGEPWSEKNVHGEYRRDIRTVVGAIGLDPDVVTAYSLRHSSITRMLLLNTPIRIIAAHHNTSVTQIEKHYSHLITNHADELIRRTLLQRPAIKIAAE